MQLSQKQLNMVHGGIGICTCNLKGMSRIHYTQNQDRCSGMCCIAFFSDNWSYVDYVTLNIEGGEVYAEQRSNGKCSVRIVKIVTIGTINIGAPNYL